MSLHELAPAIKSSKNRKRIGRGVATGNGCTTGRGTKGYKSRSGSKRKAGFEGGQMPIHRRLPKIGFKSVFRKEIAIINIKDLLGFGRNTVVDKALLVKSGLIKGRQNNVKLLGKNNIDYPLTVKVNAVSENARKKIEIAGGSVEVI